MTMHRTADLARYTRARAAVALVFLVDGALMGNWVVRVPDVRDRVDVTPGPLGLALLGAAVGSLVAMPAGGRLIERLGSRRVTLTAGLLTAAAVAGPGYAGNVALLGLALALFGAGFGTLDVAMNVQAVGVVRGLRRPVMPSFHAAFSLGGLAGAGLGGLAAGAGISPAAHLTLTGLVSAALLLAMAPFLLRSDAAPEPVHAAETRAAGRRALPARWLLIGLGAIAFCSALSEGAMADWSALFLKDVVGTSAGTAALGFAAFSVAMVAGRLGGERALLSLGPVRVLRWGGVAAAAGIVVAVAAPSLVTALVGFALVGLGFSCAFPLALNGAGESVDGGGGPQIAFVATVGYTGFLAGPPLIGFVAEQTGLRPALLAVALLSVAMAALAVVERRTPVHTTDAAARQGVRTDSTTYAA